MGKINTTPLQEKILNHPKAIFGLLAISLLFWLPSLQNGFTNWDDHVYLTDNKLIQDLSFENIKAIFSTLLMGNYHPLVPLSFAIEHAVVGMNPFLYHFDNLLLHFVNSYLVFILLLKITRSNAGSLLGTLLFVLHPIHVESVAWVTERKDVLYTLFFLLATIKWIDYRVNNKKLDLIFANILFILSCLSKGMAVVWPACLIIIELLPPSGNLIGSIQMKKLKAAIPSLIIPFLIAIGFGALTVIAQRSEGAVRTESPFLIPDNLLIASRSILFYLEKTIAPFGLSAFYPYPEPARTFPVYWYLAPALLLSIFTLAFQQNRKNSYALVSGIFLYSIIIFPVSQILPVGSAFAADRYFYLASLGICLFLAYGWKTWSAKLPENSGLIIFALLLSSWGTMTYKRTQIWKDTESLFLDVIKTYPNVPVAYNNIGNVYETKKEYQTAKAWYLKSVAAKANYTEGLMNMGVVYERLLQYDSALFYYYKLKEYHPNHPKIHNVIANASNKYGNRLREQGNYTMADIFFTQAIQWDRNYAEAWNNLGNLAFSQGNVTKGIYYLKEAVSLRPEYAEAWSNLGSVYGSSGRIDSAVICFQQAVNIDKQYGPAWFNLGYALRLSGQEKEGIQAIQNAAALGHEPAKQLLNQVK